MKIDINTPAEQIRKKMKRAKTWFIVCLVLGIIGLAAWSPVGVLLLIGAILLFLKRKAAAKLLAEQEQTAAAQAAAEQAARDAAQSVREEQASAEVAQFVEFLKHHTEVKRIHTKVVGVTFRNDDGTERQDVLSDCVPGMKLTLRPFEYHGAPAYAVIGEDGHQLGNLSAEIAQVIHDMGDDLVIRSEIMEVTGGYRLNYGCNIVIVLYRKK